MVRVEGMTEALLAQRAKLLPLRPAYVGFKDQVPLLSNSGEVVRHEPDSVSLARLVAIEELFALVQPTEGIFLPVKRQKHQLVILGHHLSLQLRWHMHAGCRGCHGRGGHRH